MFNFETYDIIKILHIVSVISWLASLLYLPRIFVYHCIVAFNSESCKIFQEMEKKLYRYIATPAMILSLIFGFYLAIQIGFEGSAWLHAKILLVFLLIGFHFYLNIFRKKFASGKNNKSHKFFRIINEVPTILMIIIIALVVLKPF
jgi:putative membrane protein